MVLGTFYQRRMRYMLPVAALLIIVFGALGATASAIARGYETTDTGLQVGMVVALSTEGSSTIERATQGNAKRVVGVVTTFENSSVTLASGQTRTLVESEGQVEVYVSDLAGPIKQGDLLAMSPLKGVLMKASDNDGSTILGIATEDVDFSTDTQVASVEQNGKSKDAKITKTKVNLNNKGSDNGQGQAEPSTLAKLGKSIVGKDVGEVRVLMAFIIFIIVLIAEGGIIYGAVSSAITALGRNPMARKIIHREIIQVLLVAIGVLLLGLGAVYAVLWL